MFPGKVISFAKLFYCSQRQDNRVLSSKLLIILYNASKEAFWLYNVRLLTTYTVKILCYFKFTSYKTNIIIY